MAEPTETKPLFSYNTFKVAHQRGDRDRYKELKDTVDKNGGLNQTPEDLAVTLDPAYVHIVGTAYQQAQVGQPFQPLTLPKGQHIDDTRQSRYVAEAELVHFVNTVANRGREMEGLVYIFELAGSETVNRALELGQMCEDQLAQQRHRLPLPPAPKKDELDVDSVAWRMF